MLTQRVGGLNLEELKVNDGQERVYYDKIVDMEDGKQYKGEWYNTFTQNLGPSRRTRETEWEFCFGKTAQNTKASSKITSPTEKEERSMQMESFTREISRMTSVVGTEFTRILMEVAMKANGKTISSMERERKHGITGQRPTKETS